MGTVRAFAAITTICLSLVFATGSNDQINGNIDYGTFQKPSAAVRPRFRYWPNDASHDLDRVAEDIRLMGQCGAGGLELLGYYLYGDFGYGGGNTAPLQSDWTVNGFGLPAWKDLQDTVLKTAQEEHLIVDLALGPNQGAGVPAPYDDEGLLWDVVMFNTTVAAGATFTGVLPGWGAGPLVAATTAMITNISSYNIPATFASEASTISKIELDEASLTDITAELDAAGNANVTFPASNAASQFQIFAFYLVPSHFREVVSPEDVAATADVPQSHVATWQQNGSFVVDHFSSRGAQTIINFWEENLLTGSTKDLLNQVGNYMWEDSQEYAQGVRVLWTPGLPAAFEKIRGYSINKYLPIIQTAGYGSLSIPATYSLAKDADEGYLRDYEQTLTELNQIYLSSLTNWSESLGLQFSAQVGYNIAVDMQQNIPLVNAPETETLGFGHNIDGYRQYAGPANLAGKRIISSEAGANIREVYQQTIPELLWDLKRSLVGGVNNFILHGWPFSGNYGNTTWPGFTTFAYLFSDMHGPRQPAFEYYSDWMDWIARCQFIAQTGVPKVDLVFWHKQTSSESGATIYWPDDLRSAGYTYEYVSPDNFDLPDAIVSDGTFAPARQAFSAMVIRGNETLTTGGVNKLSQYAREGLPIIFTGGVPTNFSGLNTESQASASSTLAKLTSLSNVKVCGYDDLASVLGAIQITPRTAVQANGTWYTHWREDSVTNSSFVFVHNDNADSKATNQPISAGTISFATTEKPYLFDAWTGSITPINSYLQESGRITIHLELAANQLVIIGFMKEQTAKDVTESPNTDMATSKRSAPAESLLIKNWTLVVESWTAPADTYNVIDGPIKMNTSYTLPQLLPWSNISEALVNVSGLGYYTAEFIWSPTEDASSAYIDFGSIVHTARASVNGQELPPLDPSWARSDVGSLLTAGLNTLEVVVSTPLGNALKPIWAELESSGKKTSEGGPSPPATAAYGLIEEVRIISSRADTAA